MLPASSCGYAREASESCPSTIKIRVWNQRLRSPSLIRPRIAFPHLRSRSREHKLRGARLRVLFFLVSIGTRALRAVCRRKAELVMENLALRQQVTALKKERPRPPLDDVDRAFWVALRASWPGWAGRLVIVNADTVARWHRERFRRYWANISKRRYPGRPRVDAEIRELIRKMAKDGWGAPRIHAELMKLGFAVSEMTVSRYMPRRPVEPDQVKRWMAFLRNHRHDIAAMDLFTVPTASLRLLFGFFVIEHGRRHIVHFNATFNPIAAWVMQQLRNAFPYGSAPRYLIFDRDSIFSPAVVEFVRALGIDPVRTSFRSPWQNGTTERWIGNCRREILKHVVVFGERHLVRRVRLYISYYHEDRCHLSLDKDTPNERAVTRRPSPGAKVVAHPRVGGLHHRYEWREAA